MLSKFRRDVAVLAPYLAQFDDTDRGTADSHTAASALTPEERHRRRRDYAGSIAWVTATEVSDEGVAALNQMRATLRLPALIVTADGPRNGRDPSSRITNPIVERRLLSNPVPRMCVGYEGPCIAPRKRQLLHEHHRTRFTNAPPAGNDGPPYW